MAHYQRIGHVPPKRHTQHRTPQGGLYYEELMVRRLLLRFLAALSPQPAVRDQRRPAVGLRGVVGDDAQTAPRLPRHLKLHELFVDDGWRGCLTR